MKNWAKIERHLFSPEQNKIHLKNGAVIKAPGITSIAQYRKENARKEPCIVARVVKNYPNIPSLNRDFAGRVDNRKQALNMAKTLRAGLMDGGTVTVKTWILN